MMSPNRAVEWESLRLELSRNGVLRSSPNEPIVYPDGRLAPWAFYSWNITLTANGLELACHQMLDRLQSFSSTQLAGYGQTSQPLLAGCVLLGRGKYTGLSIRKEQKKFLARRQIDGPLDRKRTVVVIDDSLVSGQSLAASINILEKNGFQVEGAVTLVDFSGRGGREWAWQIGYRVESVFDVWRDLGYEQGPLRYEPTTSYVRCNEVAVPDGLHPTRAARWFAKYYLQYRMLPNGPARFDSTYPAPGGTFVSFRQVSTEQRLARDGYWQFRNDGNLLIDLGHAVARTIDASCGRISLSNLDTLKIAITAAGPLEQITPSGLDFNQYAIVVRRKSGLLQLGGALPNTQAFAFEAGQWAQARTRNAGIAQHLDHELFRHTVTKLVEPGQHWLSYGAPPPSKFDWINDLTFGRAITEKAMSAMRGTSDETNKPVDDYCVDILVDAVVVAIYNQGMRAMSLERGPARIAKLVERAAGQAALYVGGKISAKDTIVVTVLYEAEQLGYDTRLAEFKVRPGLDAISCEFPNGFRTALPTAAVYNGWGKKELLESVNPGSGSGGRWTTYRTASWSRQNNEVFALRFGIARRPTQALSNGEIRSLTTLMAGHIQHAFKGPLPCYSHDPITGIDVVDGTTPRIVHSLAALLHAGEVLDNDMFVNSAINGLQHCLNHVRSDGTLHLDGMLHGKLADCVLLAAAASFPALQTHNRVDHLAAALQQLIQPDGRIAERQIQLKDTQDQDYLPGAVIWALGIWSRQKRLSLDEALLSRALAFYRERFLVLRPWAMAGWHLRGWSAIACNTTKLRVEAQRFVDEILKWITERQLETTGVFLEDFAGEQPSFNTGFIAEGVVEAWRTAKQYDHRERIVLCEQSWRRAAAAIGALTVHRADTFVHKNPQRSLGGVRMTFTNSLLRIDATSHCLDALAQGLKLI